MTLPVWHEEPIAKTHARKNFDCGDTDLNLFLRNHARQSHEKGGAKTFLAIDSIDQKTILGFYSLAPASLSYTQTPTLLCRGLARYDLPGFRLARLATALSIQGKGLGGQLLLLAGRRCLQVATEVGGIILIIDAKNERAANWYQGYGAIPLDDNALTLVLPLATIKAALVDVGKL
jgi:GNAT superfamily N-acetyltransferase